MTKTHKAAKHIARDLFSYNVNNKIKTVDEYCKLTNCSRGIVQRAIKLLEDNKAVLLVAKGQTGTYITQINYFKLLEMVEINHILGSMPLPYTKLYEGLASSLSAMLQKYVRTSFAYTRGALNRLERTEEKIYDFAIVSKQAFTEYLATNKKSKLELIKDFGNHSYVVKHIIMYNKNCLQKQEIVVGVDSSSQDHKLLVDKLAKQSDFASKTIKYSTVSSYKIIDLMHKGAIDATVWNHQDTLIASVDKTKIAFKNMEYPASFTKAVLVAHKHNTLLKTILTRAIKVEEVVKYQQKVVSGEIIPEY